MENAFGMKKNIQFKKLFYEGVKRLKSWKPKKAKTEANDEEAEDKNEETDDKN